MTSPASEHREERPVLEPRWPIAATLGLFILTSNLMGLIPGMVAPTANMFTTLACAIIVFLYYHYLGVRKQGIVGYLKHMAGRKVAP